MKTLVLESLFNKVEGLQAATSANGCRCSITFGGRYEWVSNFSKGPDLVKKAFRKI